MMMLSYEWVVELKIIQIVGKTVTVKPRVKHMMTDKWEEQQAQNIDVDAKISFNMPFRISFPPGAKIDPDFGE